MGQQAQEGTDLLIRKVAIAAQQTVILATPVDTGRARANWELSVGSPVLEASERTDFANKVRENVEAVQAYESGSNIFLTNNVPYIEELDRGSSAQAPAGFIVKAIRTAVVAVGKGRVLSR